MRRAIGFGLACAAVAAAAVVAAPSRAWAQDAPQGRYQLGGDAYVGAPFVLAIVVDGLDEDPTPSIPSLTVPGLAIAPGGADFRGGFQVTINGRRMQQGAGTWVITYRVTADKAGNYELPSTTVTQGGKSAAIRGGRIEVVDLPATNDMLIGLNLPGRPVYVGETFPAEVEWLLRKNPQQQQFSVPLLAMDATLSVIVPEPANPRQTLDFQTDKGEVKLGYQQDRVTRNGATYDRLRFPILITARKSGPIAIPPAQVVAGLEVGQGRDAFGFPTARTELFRSTDVARTLDVRPVPETDKPASFAGAVGASFSIAARASRSVVQLGEPVDLELTVKGDHRLDTVALPPLDGPGGLPKARFAVGADAPVGELSDDGLTKTFKASIQVTSPDTTEIPAIAFAYFDPAKGQYQTIHTDPIALSVKGGAVVGAAQVVGGKPVAGSNTPAVEAAAPSVSLAGVDLALSAPGAGGGPLSRDLLWAIVGLLYLVPLGLLVVRVARGRTAARREVAGEVKQALRALAAEIERVKSAPAKDAAVAVPRVLQSTARALGRTVDGGLVARIENAGFAPGAGGDPLPAELRAELANLLDDWSRDSKRGGGKGAGAGAALVLLALAAPAIARADESLAIGRGDYQAALDATDPQVKQRHFAAAEAAFTRAARTRPTAALYTDLGNAALGAGDLGGAVLAYRRALALDGDEARARRNLAWVRGRFPVELRPASSSATETLFFFASWSRDRRLIVGAAGFAVMLLVLTPWGAGRRRNLVPVAAVAGLVWLAMSVSLLFEDRHGDDVVVMQSMVLRTADSAGAPAARITPLPAGVEATLGERRGDWARIRLANGTTGWLPAGAVERVQIR